MPRCRTIPGPRFFVWTSRFGNEALCEFKNFCVTPPETWEAAFELLSRWTRSAWDNGRCDTYVILEGDSWTPPVVWNEPTRPDTIPSHISVEKAKAKYGVKYPVQFPERFHVIPKNEAYS